MHWAQNEYKNQLNFYTIDEQSEDEIQKIIPICSITKKNTRNN